jgi:hypothetical protein
MLILRKLTANSGQIDTNSDHLPSEAMLTSNLEHVETVSFPHNCPLEVRLKLTTIAEAWFHLVNTAASYTKKLITSGFAIEATMHCNNPKVSAKSTGNFALITFFLECL